MTLGRRTRGSAAHAAGLSAEQKACTVLEQAGYVILARRCRTPLGEIDIVAASPSSLVFAEVKQRRTLTEAAFALGASQQCRLLGAAEYLIQTQPSWRREATRIDLILMDNAGSLSWSEDVLRAF